MRYDVHRVLHCRLRADVSIDRSVSLWSVELESSSSSVDRASVAECRLECLSCDRLPNESKPESVKESEESSEEELKN